MPRKSKNSPKNQNLEIVKEDQPNDVDNQSDTDDNSDVDEEQFDNSDDQPIKKSKKIFVFSSEYNGLETLRADENKLRDEKHKLIKEHEIKLKELNSSIKKNRKEQTVIINRLASIHTSEIKVASKEKRKRSGQNTGGFNKELNVPQILIEYLELDEDKLLSRPKVMHLLNEKFKKEKLKNGQVTTLNSKNAKKLGKPDGFEITFSQGQKFLASFYNNEKSQIDV